VSRSLLTLHSYISFSNMQDQTTMWLAALLILADFRRVIGTRLEIAYYPIKRSACRVLIWAAYYTKLGRDLVL
jgi:hypothetical protein